MTSPLEYRIERDALTSADAVIAVSAGMRRDILRSYPQLDEHRIHVVHNGVDLDRWKPVRDDALVRSLGVDPDRPSVVFVGRITRQKGLMYLLRAAEQLPKDAQLVLCAGAPDTPEILAEIQAAVTALQAGRSGVVWLDRLLTHEELSAVLSAATTFVCPSVYEPLGIVNLEAMACETAVVASRVGGIPEVVAEGETGLLVPIEQADDGTGRPLNPQRFVDDLAGTLRDMLSDPDAARRLGTAGRARVEAQFGWDRIAERTLEIYRSLLA